MSLPAMKCYSCIKICTKALSIGKIQTVCTKTKIIHFPPGKVLDLIHRHVRGKTEIIVLLLYLSCQHQKCKTRRYLWGIKYHPAMSR